MSTPALVHVGLGQRRLGQPARAWASLELLVHGVGLLVNLLDLVVGVLLGLALLLLLLRARLRTRISR